MAAPEAWRVQVSRIAASLGQSIEMLDETLHDVYEKQQTEPFKNAIEEMHHIEDIVTKFSTEALTAPVPELCREFQHLYHDLVDIRLFLIELGLEKNPHVVERWNYMVSIYNNQLLPYFRNCPPSAGAPTDEVASPLLPKL